MLQVGSKVTATYGQCEKCGLGPQHLSRWVRFQDEMALCALCRENEVSSLPGFTTSCSCGAKLTHSNARIEGITNDMSIKAIWLTCNACKSTTIAKVKSFLKETPIEI